MMAIIKYFGLSAAHFWMMILVMLLIAVSVRMTGEILQNDTKAILKCQQNMTDVKRRLELIETSRALATTKRYTSDDAARQVAHDEIERARDNAHDERELAEIQRRLRILERAR